MRFAAAVFVCTLIGIMYGGVARVLAGSAIASAIGGLVFLAIIVFTWRGIVGGGGGKPRA